MTIEQMRVRKKELGYTTEKIAELSGVPVSTVRKIFSGVTRAPREETVRALEKVLRKRQGEFTWEDVQAMRPGRYVELIDGNIYARVTGELMSDKDLETMMVREPAFAYKVNAEGKHGSRTLEDYKAMPGGWRGEYIDGAIIDLAGPSVPHQRATMLIYWQLQEYIEDEGLDCEVFVAPTDVRLREDDPKYVQPDVFVVCDPSKVQEQEIAGAPDLVVEVLSPSTRLSDLLLKPTRYMDAGVREYWIVDLDEQDVTVYDYENEKIGFRYPFTGPVPVGISGGALELDLRKLLRNRADQEAGQKDQRAGGESDQRTSPAGRPERPAGRPERPADRPGK